MKKMMRVVTTTIMVLIKVIFIMILMNKTCKQRRVNFASFVSLLNKTMTKMTVMMIQMMIMIMVMIMAMIMIMIINMMMLMIKTCMQRKVNVAGFASFQN